jgi:uncharacterized membrane protein YwaF
MGALNLALDANYGYVGAKTPETPTVIDLVGPFPLRVFIMSALTIVLMTLATVPWILLASKRSDSS